MAQNKTQRTKASVADFLAAIPDPHRQRDAKALAALIRKATGERPAMWGSSHCRVWARALVLYLMGGLKANANLVAELGPHKVGGGCLYLSRLEEIDTKVLTRLITLNHMAIVA
jgi:hypothetical protein